MTQSPDALRERGIELERAGNSEGAERLFEQAAHGGDLAALARLAALRGGAGRPPDAVADGLYEAAASEGNTAVLFALAAAGHHRALLLLTRLRDETIPPPHP